eukprot:3882359-Rhodomonas_salina.2
MVLVRYRPVATSYTVRQWSRVWSGTERGCSPVHSGALHGAGQDTADAGRAPGSRQRRETDRVRQRHRDAEIQRH